MLGPGCGPVKPCLTAGQASGTPNEPETEAPTCRPRRRA